MIRQRIHLKRVGLAELVLRLLVSCLAVGLIFYGAMLVLAALKLSPHTLNSISADHTIQQRLTSITAHSITTSDRIIVAVSGVLCLLVFGALAWRALPRPYLARTEVDLADRDGPGRTRMAPRAIERVAETAAVAHDGVTDAAARYDSGTVDVQIDLGDAGDLPDILRGVQARVLDALRRDGLADCGVDITLAGLAPMTKEK